MSALTEEQKARIASNRQKAIEIRAQREAENREVSASTGLPNVKKPKVEVIDQAPGMSKQFTFGTVQPSSGLKTEIRINFELVSPMECRTIVKPCSPEVTKEIQAFPDSKFRGKGSTWSVNPENYDSLVKNLRSLKKIDCKVDELPAWIHRMFIDQAEQNSKPIAAIQDTVDPTLFKTKEDRQLLEKLFPYQRAGVRFGIEKGGKLLIGDEMGLGKRIQALVIMRVFTTYWPLLIVCPGSVRHLWKSQFDYFLPTSCNVVLMDRDSDQLPTGPNLSDTVIIMSYDQMINNVQKIISSKIRSVIFDESHVLKDPKTERTQVAIKISAEAVCKILLSSAPALSRPVDLFSQIKILDSSIFTSWDAFVRRYCAPVCDSHNQILRADGAEHLDELMTVLKHTIMIRRLKKNVLHDLPSKTREILYLSGKRSKERLGTLSHSREVVAQVEKETDEEAKRSALTTYFADTGAYKAPCVADYIVERYFYKDAPPVKILLFGHHVDILDIFSSRFTNKGIKHVRIDDFTNVSDRDHFCQQFESDPSVSIAILSIKAAGTGMTLTAANKVIFAELFWNPEDLFQAEDRAHCVGQQSSVSVTYILARDTADDIIWPKIKNMVIDDMNSNSERLDTLEEGQRKIHEFFTIIEE